MSLHLLNEYWLEFDGVDDYVQARNASVFENLTFPYKFRIRPENALFTLFSKGVFGPATHDYNVNLVSGQFGYYNRIGGNIHDYRFSYSPTLGVDLEYEIDLDSGDLVQKIDEVEQRRDSSPMLVSQTNNLLFTIGRSPTKDNIEPYRYLKGHIYSFQIGTETFLLDEGSGTTITGSEGTVLDIYGATWGGSPSKQINEVYIEDSGVLRPVKNVYLGTSTGLKNIYQSEPIP